MRSLAPKFRPQSPPTPCRHHVFRRNSPSWICMDFCHVELHKDTHVTLPNKLVYEREEICIDLYITSLRHWYKIGTCSSWLHDCISCNIKCIYVYNMVVKMSQRYLFASDRHVQQVLKSR